MKIENILLSFIPIFVAVDAIGVLPIFLSFTYMLDKKEKRKIILQSIATAIFVAVGFIFLGRAIFKFLGITMGDFMIAGGIILFCLSITDIINPDKKFSLSTKEFGIVPLGTPLIVGPAVLTTCLLIIPEYGLYSTLISIILNTLLAGLIFSLSSILTKFLGLSGLKALSKITSLFLGAIAVMMIRKGIGKFLL